MGGIDSLTERVSGLGDLADSADLYWAVDFARRGNQVTYTARPKDPDAHIKSPITATITGSFGDEHTEVQRQFEQALRYGASGRVVLPPKVVLQLTISGPELLAGQHSNVEVHLEPLSDSPHVGAVAELRFIGVDEQESVFEGEVTYINEGSIGVTLKIRFYGHAEVELHYPLNNKALPGDVQISYNFRRIRPTDALRVIDLVRALRTPGVCRTYIDGHLLWSLAAHDEVTRDDADAYLTQMYGLARDLAIVQEYCNTRFVIPDELTPLERVNLRVARILIEGYMVASPEAPTGILGLSGTDSPDVRALLVEGGRVSFPVQEFILRLGTRELDLGQVGAFHPHAVALNSEEALAALDAGEAKGFKVRFRPGDDPYFYLFKPDRIRDRQAPELALWSLPGIDQPGVDEEAFTSPDSDESGA